MVCESAKENIAPSPMYVENALVDVLHQGQWREGLVTSLFGDDSAVVHLLYTDEPAENVFPLRDVQPYGSHAYVGVVNHTIREGINVDVYSSELAKFVTARVTKVNWETETVRLHTGSRNNELQHNDAPGRREVKMSEVFPFKHKTNKGHPDHKLRRELLRQGRTSIFGNGIETEIVGFRDGEEEKQQAMSQYNWRNGYNTVSRVRMYGLRNEGDERLCLYSEKLREMGFEVVKMEGDGNCLFRTISHQVYGTAEYHAEVRKFCCDYMEKEHEFFQDFVEGDAQAFKEYIEFKRKDGVWGDDIEIQAMCELYNRPAEVFAYDSIEGARQLRTFHESVHNKTTPMRLSFYGGGHYDSLVGEGYHQSLISRVGSVAEARLSAVEANNTQLNDSLLKSREQYDATQHNNIEQALRDSIQGLEKQNDEVLRQSDVEATEEAALRTAIEMSQIDEIPQHGTAQLYDVADDVALQQAIEISKQENSQKHSELAQVEADLLDNEYEAQQLRWALEESENTTSPNTIKHNTLYQDEEDATLQRVLEESKLEAQEHTITNNALFDQDEETLQRVLEESKKEHGAPGYVDDDGLDQALRASAQDPIVLAEEEQMRMAIEASMHTR